MRVSFDYDGVLSTDKGKELAKRRKSEGDTIYIVTARTKLMRAAVDSIAEALGIPTDRIRYTEGRDKWPTIKLLNIKLHYDNNQEQVDKINSNTIATARLFTE